jgi:glutathione S-transferase
MLTLHHLNDSRSQRILWLLEELGLPYELKRYQRNAETRLAPPELKQVHPLGKSPIITDGDIKIAESAAIVDYIIRRYGKGAMMPAPGSAEYEAYNEWLHYSEGSGMLPLMLNLYVSRLKEAGAPLHPRIESELANHLGYVDGALKGREFFVGPSLSGADIQMSFVGDMAKVFDKLGPYARVLPSISHARLRVRHAPGIPHALFGRTRLARLGRSAPRGCLYSSSPGLPPSLSFGGRAQLWARRSLGGDGTGRSSISETPMIEPRGRGVLDTRIRGYDDLG